MFIGHFFHLVFMEMSIYVSYQLFFCQVVFSLMLCRSINILDLHSFIYIFIADIFSQSVLSFYSLW